VCEGSFDRSGQSLPLGASRTACPAVIDRNVVRRGGGDAAAIGGRAKQRLPPSPPPSSPPPSSLAIHDEQLPQPQPPPAPRIKCV